MATLLGKQRDLLDALDTLKQSGIAELVQLPQAIVISTQLDNMSLVLDGIKPSWFPREQHMIPENVSVAQEEVLRIEISRPEFPEMTIVELPCFPSTNDLTDPTNPQREPTTKTIEQYLAHPNNVILAIVSTSESIAGNNVLNIIRQHDPYGTRTLSVITCPSTLLDWGGGKCIHLAKDSTPTCNLTFGWHALFRVPKSDGRQDFIQSNAYLEIPPRGRGLALFKEKLTLILLNQSEKSLAGLTSRLQDRVTAHQQRLTLLGEERSSVTDMRNYLNNIGIRFQEIATQGSFGLDKDPFFGTGLVPQYDVNNPDTQQRTRRLRGLIRDLNQAFYSVLVAKGGRFQLVQPGEEQEHGLQNGRAQGIHGSLTRDLQHLVNLYSVDTPIPLHPVDLERIALETGSMSNGNSLSFLDGARQSSALFQALSFHWGTIAEKHTDLCLFSAKSFVSQLVGHVAPDPKTAKRLSTQYITPFFDQKRAVLREKVAELLEYYRSGCDPCPLDSHFRAVQHRLVGHQSGFPTPSSVVVQQVVQEVLARYETSLTVFTDNIVILAVENCLLRHIPTIICPDMVSEMSDETVNECASESGFIQEERKALESRLDTLRKLLATFKAYGPKDQIELRPAPISPVGLVNGTADQPSSSSFPALLPFAFGARSSVSEKVREKPNVAAVFTFESADAPDTRLFRKFCATSLPGAGQTEIDVHQHICFMDEYKAFSPEQIRLGDYVTRSRKTLFS